MRELKFDLGGDHGGVDFHDGIVTGIDDLLNPSRILAHEEATNANDSQDSNHFQDL